MHPEAASRLAQISRIHLTRLPAWSSVAISIANGLVAVGICGYLAATIIAGDWRRTEPAVQIALAGLLIAGIALIGNAFAQARLLRSGKFQRSHALELSELSDRGSLTSGVAIAALTRDPGDAPELFTEFKEAFDEHFRPIDRGKQRVLREMLGQIQPLVDPGEHVIASVPAHTLFVSWYLAVTERRVLALKERGAGSGTFELRYSALLGEVTISARRPGYTRRGGGFILKLRDQSGHRVSLNVARYWRKECRPIVDIVLSSSSDPPESLERFWRGLSAPETAAGTSDPERGRFTPANTPSAASESKRAESPPQRWVEAVHAVAAGKLPPFTSDAHGSPERSQRWSLLIWSVVVGLAGLLLTFGATRVNDREPESAPASVAARGANVSSTPMDPECRSWKSDRHDYVDSTFVEHFNSAVGNQNGAIRAAQRALAKSSSASTRRAAAKRFYLMADRAIAEATKLEPVARSLPRRNATERSFVPRFRAVARALTQSARAMKRGLGNGDHASAETADRLGIRAHRDLRALLKDVNDFDRGCG
jgi:hypothetical protein